MSIFHENQFFYDWKLQLLTKVFKHLEESFMNILRVLQELFWNFTSTVIRLDDHDYVGRVGNKFENLRL